MNTLPFGTSSSLQCVFNTVLKINASFKWQMMIISLLCNMEYSQFDQVGEDDFSHLCNHSNFLAVVGTFFLHYHSAFFFIFYILPHFFYQSTVGEPEVIRGFAGPPPCPHFKISYENEINWSQ